MKNIGKYQGITCYDCKFSEYKDAYKRGNDNGRQIYIIDGTMVQKNTIIGYYDGNSVRDVYDGKVYHHFDQDVMEFKVSKTANVTAENSQWSEKVYEVASTPGKTMTYEEVVAQEIKFSDYTKIVDEFFALLEV